MYVICVHPQLKPRRKRNIKSSCHFSFLSAMLRSRKGRKVGMFYGTKSRERKRKQRKKKKHILHVVDECEKRREEKRI